MNSASPFIGNNPDLKPGSSQLTVGIAANVPTQSMKPIQPSESIEACLYLHLNSRCFIFFVSHPVVILFLCVFRTKFAGSSI